MNGLSRPMACVMRSMSSGVACSPSDGESRVARRDVRDGKRQDRDDQDDRDADEYSPEDITAHSGFEPWAIRVDVRPARTCAGAIKTPLSWRGLPMPRRSEVKFLVCSVECGLSLHTPVREPAITIAATRGLDVMGVPIVVCRQPPLFRIPFFGCRDERKTLPADANRPNLDEPEPVTRAGPTPCRSGVSPASHSTIRETRGLPAGWAAIYPSRRLRSSCECRSTEFQLREAPCSRQRPTGSRRMGCTCRS